MMSPTTAAMLPAIEESGMLFGPYQADECFYIEKCQTYRQIQSGVKMAEFALWHAKPNNPPMIWIVEAKSSSPKAGTPNFEQYIDEIRSKFVNALALTVALCLGRHPDAAQVLPQRFQALDLAQAGFRLILVIKGCEYAWLPPLNDALKMAMAATLKTWALPPSAVVVMNPAMAVKQGLLFSDAQ